MTTETRQAIFPRGIVTGAAALLLFTTAVAATARLTVGAHVAMPPTHPVAMRELSFADMPDGGIAITDAVTGRLVSHVAPQTGGFLRGIMRGLVRGHRLWEKAPGTAFRLTRWADGRLSIEDPATRESFELEAFGSTNEKVFARLLDEPEVQRAAADTRPAPEARESR